MSWCCNFWTRTYVVQLWNQRFTDWMIRSERAIGESTFEFIVKYSVQHDSYITGTISLDGFDVHVATALLLTRTSPIWSMKYIPRVQYSYIRKWCQELLIVPASLLVWRVATDIFSLSLLPSVVLWQVVPSIQVPELTKSCNCIHFTFFSTVMR